MLSLIKLQIQGSSRDWFVFVGVSEWDRWEVVVILDQMEILTQKQKERRYNFTSYPRTKQALFQKENQALFQALLQKES